MKRLFKMFRKHYKTGYTYTVKLSDIIIQPGWNHIKTWKMNEKMNYFEKTVVSLLLLLLIRILY